MFGNKYLYQAVLSVNLACCVCFVNYDMFEGFNTPKKKPQKMLRLDRKRGKEATLVSESNYEDIYSTVPTPFTSSVVPTRVTIKTKENNFITANDNQYQPKTKMEHKKPKVNMKEFNINCPETEKPLNIGTYEIPTRRDLVLFTKRTLLKMFNSYHAKTLLLLKDIKEATRATAVVEKKCHGKGKGMMYKKCVKEINKKIVTITKGLVNTLESQQAEVVAFTEGKICDLSSMKTNPIRLIKLLAMEEAELTFALPAFLRLLGGCSSHCDKPAAPDRRPRLRKMTDQELVVRHLLASQNYLQLLKNKTYV